MEKTIGQRAEEIGKEVCRQGYSIMEVDKAVQIELGTGALVTSGDRAREAYRREKKKT